MEAPHTKPGGAEAHTHLRRSPETRSRDSVPLKLWKRKTVYDLCSLSPNPCAACERRQSQKLLFYSENIFVNILFCIKTSFNVNLCPGFVSSSHYIYNNKSWNCKTQLKHEVEPVKSCNRAAQWRHLGCSRSEFLIHFSHRHFKMYLYKDGYTADKAIPGRDKSRR